MSTLSDRLHPERYQGARRKHPYFEGWYFKLVDASETQRYAVIPGVYKGPTPETSQAFVQFMDGESGQVRFFRYPLAAFSATEGVFSIAVGPNRFSAASVELHLAGETLGVEGTVRMLDVTPWPSRWYSPGIMGPFSWVPLMECYHGVVSLDHRLEGCLQVDGRAVDFRGGRGYTEKDWGHRFPSAWIWFQSNHLGPAGTSLTASLATIPWLGGSFPGFIIGLWHRERLYRFATYTGARIDRLTVDDETIAWVVSDRHHRLSMQIARTAPGLLYAPDIADMSGRVAESLRASARVSLVALGSHESRGSVVFEGEARLGGLEVVGEPTSLGARAV